ncbi:MAG: L-lactate permease [Anaerolineales bacterium]|nr:MAG: L-lactate permease [Anaerolineales bacterium]
MAPFLLALLPILLILVLMLGLRWSAVRASLAGYLAALLISVLYFKAGVRLLEYAHLKALMSSLDVLLIIWAAFLFYRVTDEAGAVKQIGEALPHLTADRGMQALVIGWGFAAFLQGVGGFGVPVAVVAPILLGLGFPPIAAIIVPSVGSGWAVTFGSLGSAFQALLSTTGLSSIELAFPSALFLGIAAMITGILVLHCTVGWKPMLRLVPIAILLGIVMGGVQLFIATYGPWNTASFIGGMAGLLVSFGLARLHRGTQSNAGNLGLKSLGVAVSGYAILVMITAIILLIPAVKGLLGGVVIRVSNPELSTGLGHIHQTGGKSISLLNHAGAILFYAALLVYLIYKIAGRYQPGAFRSILKGTVKRVWSPSLSILLMLCMATVMEFSGMTDALARGLADLAGGLFPFVAPWIGALGAFMTGSNTNSNVVFALLQLRTAQLLGYSAVIILAGQTAGAGLASVVAPAKIVVGTSTADLAGREGEVMRMMLPYIIILVLLTSLLTSIGVLIGT